MLKKLPVLRLTKISLSLAAIVLLATAINQPVFAHPHASADCNLSLSFDAKGFAGFKVQIAFDVIYSDIHVQEIAQGITEESGTAPSESDTVKRIKEEVFEEFKDYGYFTHVLLDGKKITVQDVKDFLVTADKEDRMVCVFFVPCPVSAAAQPRQIVISIFDDSYYRDIILSPDIAVEGAEKLLVEYKIAKLENLTFTWQDKVIVPNGLSINFKNKSK